MILQYIYKSSCGRVSLCKRGKAYSVVIAGAEYGPFGWRDGLDMYRRHRGTPSRKTYSVIACYADGRRGHVEVNGKTEWPRRSTAVKHWNEFAAANHPGVESSHVTAYHHSP